MRRVWQNDVRQIKWINEEIIPCCFHSVRIVGCYHVPEGEQQHEPSKFSVFNSENIVAVEIYFWGPKPKSDDDDDFFQGNEYRIVVAHL